MTMRKCPSTRLPLPGLLAAALLLGSGLSAQAGTSSGTLAVTATVLSKNNCRFATSSLNVPFGTIDPGLTSNATVTVTSTFRCVGSAATAAYLISVDDGLWATGTNARRMRHATTTTEFMPYALSVSPTTGTVAKNVDETFTIIGTVLPVDYQNRLSGAYSDTVVLTLTP
ncbi:spore coat protein U domain-containing protein [Ramlibacter sp. PS3R-8]|uniref:spore coat protein U domain-containing protein n=1 Tax=Ramlibacter sp. PS3R-8 TaxID=3133437 RepID=UPI0030AF08FE